MARLLRSELKVTGFFVLCVLLPACGADEKEEHGGGGSAGIAGNAGTGGMSGAGGASGTGGGGGSGGTSGAGGTQDAGAVTDAGGGMADGSDGTEGGQAPMTVHLVWDFEDGTYQGFVVDSSDFDEATRGIIDHAVEALPAPLSGMGIRVLAENFSDDLWHYIARGLLASDGIVANQSYQVDLAVSFASNAPSGCFGIGGSPDAVTVKGGVVSSEPLPVLQSDGYISFSADKGNQTNIGSEAIDLGSVGTSGTSCDSENPWELLERSGAMSTVTATPDGKLWVYVGGDSGFEGSTTLYYDRVELTLTPL